MIYRIKWMSSTELHQILTPLNISVDYKASYEFDTTLQGYIKVTVFDWINPGQILIADIKLSQLEMTGLLVTE